MEAPVSASPIPFPSAAPPPLAGAGERFSAAQAPKVYRAAYRITGSAVDAEDVVQTVFLRLLQRSDVPFGEGHVVLFSNNPFWRGETQGSFFLVFNAILNFDQLNAGRKLAAR